MANHFIFNNQTFRIGDTISFAHILKEGDKERKQIFKGILMKIKGNRSETKMITVRKISRSGIGVEKIVPLASPLVSDFKVVKRGFTRRAKIYFIRDLSAKQLIRKIYRKKQS